MTRDAFENALNRGSLWTLVGTKWYVARRNGRTRFWKRDPARFEIPIKFRFRDCVTVTSCHFDSGEVDQFFRIAMENPSAQAHIEDR